MAALLKLASAFRLGATGVMRHLPISQFGAGVARQNLCLKPYTAQCPGIRNLSRYELTIKYVGSSADKNKLKAKVKEIPATRTKSDKGSDKCGDKKKTESKCGGDKKKDPCGKSKSGKDDKGKDKKPASDCKKSGEKKKTACGDSKKATKPKCDKKDGKSDAGKKDCKSAAVKKDSKPCGSKDAKPAAAKKDSKPCGSKDAKPAAAKKDSKPCGSKDAKPAAANKDCKAGSAKRDGKSDASKKDAKSGGSKIAKLAAAKKDAKSAATKKVGKSVGSKIAKPAAALKDAKSAAAKKVSKSGGSKDAKSAAPKKSCVSAAPKKDDKSAAAKKDSKCGGSKDAKPAAAKKDDKCAAGKKDGGSADSKKGTCSGSKKGGKPSALKCGGDKKNMAWVLKKVGEIKKEGTDKPKPGANDVLIKVDTVGICSLDVQLFAKGKVGPFKFNKPIVLGHEASGIVSEAGKGVKTLKKGDRVAIEPGLACNQCSLCKAGRYNLCASMKFCAAPPTNGSLVQYFNHPANLCYKLPDSITMEEGALLEPLAVGVAACRRAQIRGGDTIFIMGAGTMGIVTMLVAKSYGAAKVLVSDVNEDRLDMMKEMGADLVMQVAPEDKPIDVAKNVKKILKSEPKISINCCGCEQTTATGIYATAPGGVCCLVGMSDEFVKIPILAALSREIDIRGAFRYCNDYSPALKLLQSGRINQIKNMVTHHFDFEEVSTAFDTVKCQKDGVLKALVHVQPRDTNNECPFE